MFYVKLFVIFRFVVIFNTYDVFVFMLWRCAPGSMRRSGTIFDLEVKKGDSIKENQLKWKISNPDIVDFANRKKTGHEVDFYAKKCGTTKITCSYTNSKGEKKSVVYTGNVVAADDD